MILNVVRLGLYHVSSGQRRLKGNYQAQVHLDELVLGVVRQGGGTVWAVAKDIQWKAKKLKSD
jgi:hypothetical protein